MADTQFPIAPVIDEHFVDGNRLWVFDGSKWNLWGNLQYVPIQGEKGATGGPGKDGAQGVAGSRGIPGTPGIKGPKGDQGVDGVPGPGLEVHVVVDVSDQLKQVTKEGVLNEDLSGELDDESSILWAYRHYIPTIGDAASQREDDPEWANDPSDPSTYPHPTASLFVWTEAEEWIWTGVLGGQQGPRGEKGLTGQQGGTGPGGQNGKNGLNGAHGGANAQVISYVPSSGPPGRLYLYDKDMTLYITTAQSED